jgi:hypothetical protein
MNEVSRRRGNTGRLRRDILEGYRIFQGPPRPVGHPSSSGGGGESNLIVARTNARVILGYAWLPCDKRRASGDTPQNND